MKKKILFVTTWFMRWWAEKQIYHILNWLKDKYQIKIVGFVDWYYKEEYKKLWIEVAYVPLKSQLSFPKAVYQTNKIVKIFNPDIIQSFLPHANIVTKFVNAFNLWKYTVLTWFRNSHIPESLWKLEKYTERFCKKIITNSHTNKDILTKRWFDENKIKVIYNWFDYVDPKEKYDFEKKTILTVGKLRDQKDYPTNIKTAKKLLEYRNDFQFLYVGEEWDWYEKLQELINQYWMQNYIKILWKRDDIPELMSSCDIFFLPTKFEWQANVLMEAMYYGLPIVTTDIPENREICDWFFEEIWDYKALAKDVNDILDGKKDCEDKLKNNKEFIKKFTIDSMIEKYLEVYDDV